MTVFLTVVLGAVILPLSEFSRKPLDHFGPTTCLALTDFDGSLCQTHTLSITIACFIPTAASELFQLCAANSIYTKSPRPP